jgi:hypothetical protein
MSATKQLGVFTLNLYGCNLQKLQVMCEFREYPLSDNHTLFDDVGQLLPYFHYFVIDLWEIRYGRSQHNPTGQFARFMKIGTVKHMLYLWA